MTLNIKNILRPTIILTLCMLSFMQGHAEEPACRKIIVQGSDSYPPFEFINEKGEADGFNIDILKAVMNVTNMPYEIQLINWDQAIGNMLNNRIDALAGVVFSEERAGSVRFCLPHCEVNRNIVCRKGDPYTSMEALSGKEVIVQRGGWSEKYVKKSGLTDKIILVDDMQEALYLLERGKHHAVIGSDLVAMSAIKKFNFRKLEIHQTPIEPQQYSIVVSQDNEALLHLINMGLQELKTSGEYDRIYNKWFGVYSRGGRISETMFYSFALALVLVLISLIVVAVLRRKIRRATKTLDKLNSDLQLSLKAGEVSAWRYDPKTGIIKSLYGDTFAARDIMLAQFTTMLHPDDVNRVTEVIRKIETGELKTASLIFRLMTAEGEYSYIQSEMIVERHAKTDLSCVVGTQKDVTQQQKMEEEKKEVVLALKMAIEVASLFVWYYDVDSDSYFVLKNEKFTKTEYTYKSVMRHIHPDDVTLYRSDLDDLLSGKIDSAQIILRVHNYKSEDYSYLESTLVAVNDPSGRVCKVAINQRDITEKCRKKLELESAHKSLDMAMQEAELTAWDYNIATRKHRILYGNGCDNVKYDGDISHVYCHPEDKDLYIQAINRVTSGISDRENFSIRKIKNDWQYGYFDGLVSSIKDSEGKVLSLVGSFRDITARKENELAIIESNRELKQLDRKNKLILNNTNSGLAYINKDYVVEWENISVCSANLSFEAYKTGEKCYKSAHNRDIPCENCVFQRVLQSRNLEIVEFTFDNKSTIEVFATPVINDNDEIEGIVIRLDDITERKQFYQELADAKEKAERSDKLKSAFLANISHEIRTPLNAIIGFSELIVSCDDPDEKAEYSRIVSTNSELLLKLISDIIELSKIESGVVSVTLANNDLSSCFDDIAMMMRPRMPEGVELICENPYSKCLFDFDKERLTQVVTNFLANAIKFTSKGYIKMGYEYINDGIRFYVTDTGIGIAKDDIPKVFTRFGKVDSFAQGTGLGMTICKAIVEAAGAELGVDSILGEGSTFWFFVPCSPIIEFKSEHISEF